MPWVGRLRRGDRIYLGDEIEIAIEEKKDRASPGQNATTVSIKAPQHLAIVKEEALRTQPAHPQTRRPRAKS
ncbi:UNVERIFIED_CONTAM: hypothetical protein BEN50_24710 [Euhalothece sp. KZN 001]